jgi:hypothetical protein
MKDGFVKDVESWSTAIQHKTKHLRVKIIFPGNRPPSKITLFQSKGKKSQTLSEFSIIQLPDGRSQITWEKIKPKVFEEYLLKWRW